MSHHTEALSTGLPNRSASPVKTEKCSQDGEATSLTGDSRAQVLSNHNELQRQVGNRQIQLVAMGASIGTALFVSIGQALERAGPAGLLIAFVIQSTMLGMVNNCMAEMCVYMPVSGGFVRTAGKWVDDAFGFMAGWNFFFYQAITIPFEITAITIIISYWRDDIPPAAVCAASIGIYALLNVAAVKVYGEAEFWLSSGKVCLLLMVFSFIFITMVGGNPQGDAYGFRYWNNPGPFATYRSNGDSGRFEGFLDALWSAAFTCVGPEYISLIAAEAKHPHRYLKTAFKMVYWRFCVFYIGSALAVGIVVAYNDPTLLKNSSGGSGASSPYVIAMGNMGITVLPDIVNALLVTSIFSAGNGCTYYATRNLYGMAVAGRAPKILTKCTKQGVPIYAFAVVMGFPFLSFLQLSNNSQTVLEWLVKLSTAAIVIDYIVICTTYVFFYRACVAQGLDRSRLPYKGWFQPWSGYIGAVWMLLVVLCYGYSTLKPFSLKNSLIDYILVLMMPVLYCGWKVFHKTKLVKPTEADLTWDALEISAYEEATSGTDKPVGFLRHLIALFTCGKRKDRDREAEIS